MKLLDYLKDLADDGARKAFATKCGTSLGYLRLVAYGHKPASEGLAIRIEVASERKVQCEEVLPDVDWAYLRNSKGPTKERRAAASQ